MEKDIFGFGSTDPDKRRQPDESAEEYKTRLTNYFKRKSAEVSIRHIKNIEERTGMSADPFIMEELYNDLNAGLPEEQHRHPPDVSPE